MARMFTIDSGVQPLRIGSSDASAPSLRYVLFSVDSESDMVSPEITIDAQECEVGISSDVVTVEVELGSLDVEVEIDEVEVV